MDIFSILTIVSIVLGVVSATLAVAAFIFGWISFRNTSHMQMEAQAILAKVSEKVEVIVDRTSHQIDKAWEYFTKPSSRHESKPPELPNELKSGGESSTGPNAILSVDEVATVIWGLLFFIPKGDRVRAIETVKPKVRDGNLNSILTLFLKSKPITERLSPVEEHVYMVSKELGEAIFKTPPPQGK